MKIYTKGGDEGETSLLDGTRVKKSSAPVEVYGEIDELNAYLGLTMEIIHDLSEEDYKIMEGVQFRLFELGSQLACPSSKRKEFKLPDLDSKCLQLIENRIDHIESELPVLKNFILPGGSQKSAYVQILRTKCRKCERFMVKFFDEKDIPRFSIALLNRLSDYFFVLSRYILKLEGKDEKLWKTS